MLGLEQQNFVLVNCVGICLVMTGCRVDSSQCLYHSVRQSACRAREINLSLRALGRGELGLTLSLLSR